MKTRNLILSALTSAVLVTVSVLDTQAQENTSQAYVSTQPYSLTKPKKWGIEADLLVPFIPTANIITARVTRTIIGRPEGPHGDLLMGVYLRPNVKHDIVDKINEYLFTMGYRQYLYKGWHIEAQADAGIARGIRNKIDGKDYENFSLLVEAHTGYKFNFRSNKSYNFYLLPQVGILQGAVTDIGPRGGKSDTFMSAKVHLGIAF